MRNHTDQVRPDFFIAFGFKIVTIEKKEYYGYR